MLQKFTLKRGKAERLRCWLVVNSTGSTTIVSPNYITFQIGKVSWLQSFGGASCFVCAYCNNQNFTSWVWKRQKCDPGSRAQAQIGPRPRPKHCVCRKHAQSQSPACSLCFMGAGHWEQFLWGKCKVCVDRWYLAGLFNLRSRAWHMSKAFKKTMIETPTLVQGGNPARTQSIVSTPGTFSNGKAVSSSDTMVLESWLSGKRPPLCVRLSLACGLLSRKGLGQV